MKPRGPKPRNGTVEQFRRAAQRLDARGQTVRLVMTVPGEPFRRAPDDIMISRLVDGVVRTKEDALEIAKRRSASATYKGCDSRWFAFRP